MIKNSSSQNDPLLLTFGDLIHIVRRNQKKIALAGIIGAVIALFYALLKPIEYEAVATFKDKGKTQTGLSKSISELIFLAADASESEALMMMRSRTLCEELVKETGMQLCILEKGRFFPLEKIKNNMLAEYAAYKQLSKPLIDTAAAPIAARSIVYNGEAPLALQLVVTSDKNYLLQDQRKNRVAEGQFGESLKSEAFSFMLIKREPVAVGSSFALTLLPLGKTAEKIAKKFRIEPDRFDKSFLKVSYRHPDRQAAAAHVGHFMRLYQNYLHKEQQRLATLQVDYLQERQNEMGKRLKLVMQEHAQELSSDLSSTGFSNSEKALEFLAAAQQNIRQKLLAITLELNRMELVQKKGPIPFENLAASLVSANNQEVANQLAKEIRLLRQEADAIHRIQENDSPLQNLVEEFQGINLATARELYLHYSQELSQLEAQILQLQFTIAQIDNPAFEISSLSTVLNDPVSLEMITKASGLSLSQKDTENRSQKELERISADLAIQRGFLVAHLNQNVSLLNIRQELLRKKLQNLQIVILERIQEQIAILGGQIAEFSRQNKEMLKQEKVLLEESLADIRQEMAMVPQKWTVEASITQQLDLNRSMIEEITKLVESKNISNNLEFIQSAPVDHPLVPLHPVAPHLFLISLLGACFGVLLSLGWVAGHALAVGINPSKDNLQRAGFHVSGTLSMQTEAPLNSLRDGDLETLRSLVNYFSSAQSASLLLIQEGGPDCVGNVAELLFKRGLKVLVIDLCFDCCHKPCSGLIQYLEGSEKTPHIENKQSGDFLASGGVTRFAAEMLGSARFTSLLEGLEKKYDWILAYSNAALDSAEAETLLSIFSRAAVILTDQTLNELDFCLRQAQNPEKRITFLLNKV